ncbi:hypothetical protein E5Q_00069 [Mixia osmundae IAM 14324]|uniref:Transcription initiation factor TFIID subunit 1 histone acetyltransferase domain-containing protein n=1 Tax=Mixia osmundae (strain CBS 9802 / IAM 14324 / JCM 22182 / KY 12970) TaxID=764103 RepID=G7DS68_MIXOS|nr:hypothetical protein E5Q_00069 [Mixia osmundae IAM 14324]
MDQETAAISSLGSFAISRFLGDDLGQDGFSSLSSQLGGSGKANLDEQQIYNDRFESDEESDDGASRQDGKAMRGRDWEAEIDKEDAEEAARAIIAAPSQHPQSSFVVRGEDMDFDDDDDDDDGLSSDSNEPVARVKSEELEPELPSAESSTPELMPAQVRKPVDIRTVFPDFQSSRPLPFTSMFCQPRKRRRLDGFDASKRGRFKVPSKDEVGQRTGTGDIIVAPLDLPTQAQCLQPRGTVRGELARYVAMAGPLRQLFAEQDSSEQPEDPSALLRDLGQEVGQHLWEVEAWEDQIVWDRSHPPPSHRDEPVTIIPKDPGTKPNALARQRAVYRNPDLETGKWLDAIRWTGIEPDHPFLNLQLSLNDPQISWDAANQDRGGADEASSRMIVRTQQGLDWLNHSNDSVYASTFAPSRRRIRQTFANLEVRHSYPAIKLQMPFYKPRLPKAESRFWHRPNLQFPNNIAINFERVRSSKKRKDEQGRKLRASDSAQALHTTSDLSLRDTSEFILLEFSEEHPPIMSNYGMGTLLVNYYRKRDTADAHVPNAPLGQPFILDGADDSPFMRFGDVKPGQTVTGLYNNLLRAPVYKHAPAHTDFLVIRHTVQNESKYFIRAIKNIFTVGQILPAALVPPPQARALTISYKQRFQYLASKLAANSKHHQFKTQKIAVFFPDQTETQVKGRLKEFMDSTRSGNKAGHWTLKASHKPMEDAEFRKLHTPEQHALAEAMQVGQQHLLDSGYSKLPEVDDEDADESKLDVEQQLAPWNTTKNFQLAAQKKAMLQLFGPGDPTGRSEGFSFLKVSMKDIFLREGESRDARLAQLAKRPKGHQKISPSEQHAIYEEEIERIWKAQNTALSSHKRPQLTVEDEMRARGSSRDQRGSSVYGTPAASGLSPGQMSRASSPERSRMHGDADETGSYSGSLGATAKFLKIKRRIGERWMSEIVRDPAVIAAYTRQRQIIEDKSMDVETVVLSNDPKQQERQRRLIEEQLQKLRKKAERREQRKAKQLGTLDTFDSPGPSTPFGDSASADGSFLAANILSGSQFSSTSDGKAVRKCSNCGALGHMRTNRKCPLYSKFKEESANKAIAPSPAAAVFGTPSYNPILSQGVTSAGSPPTGSSAPPKLKLSFGGQR